MRLQKTNPRAYWSPAVQESLQCAVAAQDYAAHAATNPDYEPEMAPAPEMSEAQLWTAWRAAGGGNVSGGRVGDHYDVGGEQEDGTRRDDGVPRLTERRIPIEQRANIMRPAVYGPGAIDNQTKEEQK